MGELIRVAAPEASVDVVVDLLHREGCVVVEGLVSAVEVAALREALEPHREANPLGRNDFEGYDTKRIYALFAKTRALDDLAVHPLLLGVLDRVLGHYQLSGPVGIDIGPGESAQGLHRDDVVYPIPWPHEQVVLNTMWALDDFTEDNGATRIAPGSHRSGPAEVPSEGDVVTATMPAGSVMFYVGTVWHGGGANHTDARRLGVILEYAASWLRAQENHVTAVSPDVVRTLAPRLQELLGYNIHPPFLGYVDGRHPRRALDAVEPRLGGLRIDGPAWLAAVSRPELGPEASDDDRMAWLAELLERQVAERTGGPFAAAVFDGRTGDVLAAAVNRVEPLSACVAHAETLALAEAGQTVGSYNLEGREAVLVTTAEPCAMCLGALTWSGVVRVVSGAGDADARAIGFDEGDKPTDWPTALRSRGIVVVQGVQRDRIVAAMRRYLDAGGTVYNG